MSDYRYLDIRRGKPNPVVTVTSVRSRRIQPEHGVERALGYSCT
jgi:hypothetical protein